MPEFTRATWMLPFNKNNNPDRREHLLALADLYRRFRDLLGHSTMWTMISASAIRNAAGRGTCLDHGSCSSMESMMSPGQQSSLLAALKD